MGILIDKFVKDKTKGYWITAMLDVVLIASLIFFAFHIKGEWQNGFSSCRKQACAICIMDTYNKTVNEMPDFNFTMNITPLR